MTTMPLPSPGAGSVPLTVATIDSSLELPLNEKLPLLKATKPVSGTVYVAAPPLIISVPVACSLL